MSAANTAYLVLVLFAFGAFAVVLFTTYLICNLPPRQPKLARRHTPERIEHGPERRKAA